MSLRTDEDFRREIEAHIALEADRLIAEGMDPADARAAAMRRFGNATAAQERFYHSTRVMWVDHLWQDLRFATRSFARSPGFTAVAILTLAIGIGASTIAFTHVNAVFFSNLPVSTPEALRTIAWTSSRRAFAKPVLQGPAWDARIAAGHSVETFSETSYFQMRDSRTFTDIACWRHATDTLVESGLVFVQAVSGNYFRTLGVRAAAGRLLEPDDDRIAASPAAVVTHNFWRRELGANPDLSSRAVVVSGVSFVVVGILPEGFAGLDPMSPADVFVANAADTTFQANDRSAWSACRLVGRLAPGVAEEQSRVDVERLIAQSILATPPAEPYEMPRIRLWPIDHAFDDVRNATGLPLALLMITVSIILLITCANIAGLLLARGRARRREIAIRLSIGAPRSRIIRQLITESLLLSSFGGAVGIIAAFVMSPRLPGVLAELGNLTMINVSVAPDSRVIVFSIALSAVAGLLFGVVPAFRATRLQPASLVKSSASHWAVDDRGRGGRTIIAAQVTMAMVLLVGAGLFIRTFVNLKSVPIGYNPDGLLFALTSNPPGRPRAFVDEALVRLRNLPGVTSATVSQWPLFNNTTLRFPFCVPGNEPSLQRVDLSYMFPGFFATWGVTLLAGHDFSEGALGVIVNETFVSRFFHGRQPLGEMIGINGCPGQSQAPIIGVVANHVDRQRVEQVPAIYLPYPRQGALYTTTYALRTSADPSQLVSPVRRLLAELDMNPDGDVTLGTDYRERSTRRERVLTALLVLFGSVAMFIACLGIYAMLAYTVTWRTSEIGIRMALGARRTQVVLMILRESLLPVAAGLALGVVVAIGLSRFVESVLFGISARDPWTIASAAVLFLLTATIAASLPALRASGIDPLPALRHE